MLYNILVTFFFGILKLREIETLQRPLKTESVELFTRILSRYNDNSLAAHISMNYIYLLLNLEVFIILEAVLFLIFFGTSEVSLVEKMTIFKS
jgi:hypothetical protein